MDLKTPRWGPACGVIVAPEANQELLVVAGGYDGNYLSSVELHWEGQSEFITGITFFQGQHETSSHVLGPL